MRTALRLLIGLLLLVVLVVAAAYVALSGSLARLDGSLALRGPTAPVTLERDALGTLTVQAANRRDAAWALGFAHGQDRFFQMDLLRRVAAGELAALAGERAVGLDMNHRVHRMRAVVEAAYEFLPNDQREVIDAYRDGVNAGLGQLRVRPWEYLLLRQEPKPWKSEDTLLALGAMYFDLNENGTNGRELGISRLRVVLPASLVDALVAPDPTWEAPLDGSRSPDIVLPGPGVFDLRGQEKLAEHAIIPASEAMPGSNSFAVGGMLTENGAAIVANDMHLGLRVPNIWFRARIRFPDASAPGGIRDLNGVTLPGTPALVAGSNGQVAWGFTNSYGDWMDFVRVTRDKGDPSRYTTPTGSAAFTVHDEVIEVAGAESRHLKVEDTPWGPLAATDTDGTPLALAWIAHRPDAFNLGIMALERATDTHAALAVASRAGMPPQNLLVGDRTGHIAWTIIGDAIPLREPGVPGWTGFADAGSYPRVIDPADGRLWTANNRTVGGAALALLGNGGHDLGARAQQIRDDLQAREHFVPGDMLSIQLDDRALFLSRWNDLLQATLSRTRDGELDPLRQATARWMGHAAVDSVDYRVVRTFREYVHALALAPFAARATKRFPDFTWPRGTTAEGAVWQMLVQRPPHLLDPSWASWDALLEAAARQTAQELATRPGGIAARTWGEQNTSHIEHALSGALPHVLSHFVDMPVEPLAGDTDMPRVQAPAFGASERFAISPGHEDESYLEMPGGQSGHPLSPFHGAGHEAWVQGHLTPLLPGPGEHTLVISPR
ncbi:MAG TPA: penicillin acylase family protein [Luteibacter sp.]|jgi:penicillin amidase|uniref:penicillin acylase family protein n=1 Tax=Luteibacter sp. TaxID=1886636 RepID=UPI002F3EB102